jgi:hypothetical protein
MVAHHHRDVDGSEQCRIHIQAQVGASSHQQSLGHLVDRHRPSAADVVHRAGFTVLDRQPIRPDDITHIGQIPAGSQVANREAISSAGLGGDNPGSQSGDNERIGLTGPDVVKGSNPDHAQAVSQVGLDGQHLCCRLAGGIGRHRGQGRVLVDRLAINRHLAVDLGRADHQDGG